MKIAIIGYGNMANALLNGILSSNDNIVSDSIYIFHNKKNDTYSQDKCIFLNSGQACNKKFDIILLCVKPKDIESAINENKNIFEDNQVLVSVIAGITIESIKKTIEKKVSVVRAMPNLCAIFNESITGICADDSLSLDKKKYIEDIFRTIGHLKEIKEDEMDSFTALFGSGPAYIMYFIEALIDSEEFSSISKEDKSLLILHLLSSTSKMLFITEDIKELRSKVTSKGGTTEAAIKTLEENNFSKILKKAINNARRKSLEISK